MIIKIKTIISCILIRRRKTGLNCKLQMLHFPWVHLYYSTDYRSYLRITTIYKFTGNFYGHCKGCKSLIPQPLFNLSQQMRSRVVWAYSGKFHGIELFVKEFHEKLPCGSSRSKILVFMAHMVQYSYSPNIKHNLI
jgi:hypothetical protein